MTNDDDNTNTDTDTDTIMIKTNENTMFYDIKYKSWLWLYYDEILLWITKVE